MATPTTNNRFEKQTFGSNVDTWGVGHLTPAVRQIDQSLDGVLNVDVSVDTNPLIMTTVDYELAPFRNRVINITGYRNEPYVITLPFTNDKYYIVNNQATSMVIINGRILEQIGVYRLVSNNGTVSAESRAARPQPNPVDEPIIRTPSVRITPDLIGTTTYIDPTVTTEIVIGPSVVENVSSPNFTGLNQIIFMYSDQEYTVNVIGLCNMDGEPVLNEFHIVNGIDSLPLLATAPVRYLNLGMVPGTDKVFPVSFYLRGSVL